MNTERRSRPSAYRHESGYWLIEIKLREVRQLFQHLDPAPFREKDLDPAAEEYIGEAIRELGPSRPAKLLVYLPAIELHSGDAQQVPEAVANFFAYRAQHARQELRRLLQRGAANLAIGLLFLFLCLSVRRSLESLGAASLLSEGLLIIGWVALWRPVEIFLYDWWPVVRRIRQLTAAARMPVEVRAQSS
jgi:hypothetical protein